MSRARLLAVVVAWALSLQPAHASPTFDRTAWIADFELLRRALTLNYTNLEWAVERGMDLPATERRARKGLEAATSDHEARAVLERFIRDFGDGHLELVWPRTESRKQGRGSALTHVCERLGFRSRSASHAIGARLPGYRPLETENPIAAGTVTLGGKTAAVLRVEEFGPSARECGAALAELGVAVEAVCDAACGELVRRRADMLFVRGVEHRVRALARPKPDFLLVDLAANGGGNPLSRRCPDMLG